MGFLSTILGFFGFGVGISSGLVVGYYLFIYFQPSDVKDPVIRPLAERDDQGLQSLLPEIPLWVKCPDYQRVDWLNKFLELMWPYLDKAICKTAKNIATPIIAEQIPKYKIESVEFETLTLGSLPPTFQGMKVYVTDEKELIMEPSLKWAANPNITLAVRAYGLKATVQVVDLQVFAAPRITLKPLVPSFPCFAKIFVSLMEKPHVDFGLKLVGADLMSIPGVYPIVQDVIKNQVASMYLWPKTLEVQILDPAKAMKRPVGILHVKILKAMKLRKKDILGASDPYVKLKLTESKLPSKKTTVKHKNLNPEWNEEFTMLIKDPETQALQINVYDWEQIGKHDKMGMNVVPVKELTPDEPKVMTLTLLKNMDPNDVSNDKERGQIVVELTYKPFKEDDMPKDFTESGAVQMADKDTPPGGGQLVVIVHEAQDVEGKHHTNPYVRVTFRGEEKKTKHIKKNRDPRWEEEFTFTVEEPPVNDRLHVEVLSQSSRIGLLHPKENLGYIDISLADVVNNKRINEKFHLIDSKNGVIQIELQWREAPPKEEKEAAPAKEVA
ncbi:OLC1v1003480C1 [Oldenlandia corymbosa var. corymbosa]|uniref:OLC1v1003480C1 n=2 Tax=Oldenlandia corymbosa var. corymbosa TaxID=529605 RepID=A0AAV1DDI4_OLDCO|nr:OLC1v1003480C1 [Oldenlandia corymbosa var. corymbosa]